MLDVGEQYPEEQSLPDAQVTPLSPLVHVLVPPEQNPEEQSLPESQGEVSAPSLQTCVVLRQLNEAAQSFTETQAVPTAPSVHWFETQNVEEQSLPDPQVDPTAPSVHWFETQNVEEQSLPDPQVDPTAPSVHVSGDPAQNPEEQSHPAEHEFPV